MPLHGIGQGQQQAHHQQHLGTKKAQKRYTGKTFSLPTVTLAKPFTLSPMRFRWSCSGSDAQRRKVATSLATCDMVAGVPGPRKNRLPVGGLGQSRITISAQRISHIHNFKGIGTLQD